MRKKRAATTMREFATSWRLSFSRWMEILSAVSSSCQRSGSIRQILMIRPDDLGLSNIPIWCSILAEVDYGDERYPNARSHCPPTASRQWSGDHSRDHRCNVGVGLF